MNRLAREAVESALPLVWVCGEMSNLVRATSGHVYFTLKDDVAQVRCVMFRQRAQLTPFRLSNGALVEIRALPTLYEPRGEFQLGVESIRPAGVGAMYEAYERLRAKLAADGLFDANRKRPLPPYPETVVVVTSKNAAALQDILTTLRRRAPCLRLKVVPVAVQGSEAAPAMVAALRALKRSDGDVVILARGGGSIEDLWAFNDEGLARSIAQCALPVVTGIGHETDTSIADLVADRRAATPTAAAELVSAGFVAASLDLERLADQLAKNARRLIEKRAQQLDSVAARLSHPGEQLATARLHAKHLSERLQTAVRRALSECSHRCEVVRSRVSASRPRVELHGERLLGLVTRLSGATQSAISGHRSRLEIASASLQHLDPRAALGRGFALVQDATGQIVTSATTLALDDAIHIQFAADAAEAKITGLAK